MDVNGVTRREFERLERKVDNIDEHGSRELRVLKSELKDLKEDVRELARKVESNTRAQWSLGAIFLIGCVGIITALVTGGN